MKSNFNFNQKNYNKSQSLESKPSLALADDSCSLVSANYSLTTPVDVNWEQKLRNRIKDKASQGEYQVAIALLDQLIEIAPDNAADYNNRGLMYFRNNQIPEAMCDLSYALAINPNLDSAYNNRANCYAVQGELLEAIADYDLALDLNPANLRAWINQGITFRELELYDLAIENFDITLIIGNSLTERIYAERGRTYHLRGDWNCAVADYQQALKILSHQPQLLQYRRKVRGWLDSLLCPLISYNS